MLAACLLAWASDDDEDETTDAEAAALVVAETILMIRGALSSGSGARGPAK